MSKVLIGAALAVVTCLMVAAHSDARTITVSLCGQTVYADSEAIVLLGSWNRKSSPICAGLVVDGPLDNARADYVGGQNFRTTLFGSFDARRETLYMHDREGSSFTFNITSKTGFDAKFAGGSGSLTGHFETISRRDMASVDAQSAPTREPTQPKPPPASLQREPREQQNPSTSKHSEPDVQFSAEREHQNIGRSMAPTATSEPAINSDLSGIVDKKLTQCVMPEAQWGRYSSLDGGKSAGDILNDKCTSVWFEWVKACEATGAEHMDCITRSAIIAQLAIKAFGK